MARKFERKAGLRETWLREMGSVLQDFDLGRNIAQVEASMKKQQAIAADIMPRVCCSYILRLFLFLKSKSFNLLLKSYTFLITFKNSSKL